MISLDQPVSTKWPLTSGIVVEILCLSMFLQFLELSLLPCESATAARGSPGYLSCGEIRMRFGLENLRSVPGAVPR